MQAAAIPLVWRRSQEVLRRRKQNELTRRLCYLRFCSALLANRNPGGASPAIKEPNADAKPSAAEAPASSTTPSGRRNVTRPRALIITPTRELAAQVCHAKSVCTNPLYVIVTGETYESTR